MNKIFLITLAVVKLFEATSLAAIPDWAIGTWGANESKLKADVSANLAISQEQAAKLFDTIQMVEGAKMDIGPDRILITHPKETALLIEHKYKIELEAPDLVSLKLDNGRNVLLFRDKITGSVSLASSLVPSNPIPLTKSQVSQAKAYPTWIMASWRVDLARNPSLLARLNFESGGDKQILSELKALHRDYTLTFTPLGAVIEVSGGKQLMAGDIVEKDENQVLVKEVDGSFTRYIKTIIADTQGIVMKDEATGEETVLLKIPATVTTEGGS